MKTSRLRWALNELGRSIVWFRRRYPIDWSNTRRSDPVFVQIYHTKNVQAKSIRNPRIKNNMDLRLTHSMQHCFVTYENRLWLFKLEVCNEQVVVDTIDCDLLIFGSKCDRCKNECQFDVAVLNVENVSFEQISGHPECGRRWLQKMCSLEEWHGMKHVIRLILLCLNLHAWEYVVSV